MYIYEGHLGTLYATEYPIEEDRLFCRVCGDWDTYYGYASNREEAWKIIRESPVGIDEDGSGGWDYDYVKLFIEENWDE